MPAKSGRPRGHPFVSCAMNISPKNQIANKGSPKMPVLGKKNPFVQLPQSNSAETSHPVDLTIGSPNPTQSPCPLPPFPHNPNPPRQLPRAHVIAMIENLPHDQPLHRREPRQDGRHPVEEDPVAVMHVRADGSGQRGVEQRRRHLDLHRGEPGAGFQRGQGRGVFGVPGWVYGFGDHVACVGDSRVSGGWCVVMRGLKDCKKERMIERKGQWVDWEH